jgi:hypothetical protein
LEVPPRWTGTFQSAHPDFDLAAWTHTPTGEALLIQPISPWISSGAAWAVVANGSGNTSPISAVMSFRLIAGRRRRRLDWRGAGGWVARADSVKVLCERCVDRKTLGV